MAFLAFLNQWWNLPYLVLLGLVAVFFALQAFGLAAHALEGDADVDVDGADHDLDHDLDPDDETLAAFFGVGRVPFVVVWLTLFIFTGFTGLFVNRVLQARAGGYPRFGFPVSLALSLFAGALAVRICARAVHRLVDTGGRGAARRQELAGRIGVVASPQLDARFGEVRVHDARGNELIVHGHLGEGEPALTQGARVVLVELKQDGGLFLVAALKE